MATVLGRGRLPLLEIALAENCASLRTELALQTYRQPAPLYYCEKSEPRTQSHIALFRLCFLIFVLLRFA